MNKEKLLDVLTTLLDSQPDIKHDMMTYMPAPTIPSAMAVLDDMEKKIWASFPYDKRGHQRDQYTFSRVKESLLDFIDTITQYTHHFVSSPTVFPTTCFEFLDQVTSFAHRLPTWELDQHNQPQRDLYNDLATFWKLAIQHTFGKRTCESNFNSDTMTTWAKSMAHHNSMAANHHWLDIAIHEFNQCYFSLPPHTTATTCHTPLHQPPALYHQQHPSSTSTSSTSPMVGYADFR
ncbi:unnamed protein product [Absidia cylindrospora]